MTVNFIHFLSVPPNNKRHLRFLSDAPNNTIYWTTLTFTFVSCFFASVAEETAKEVVRNEESWRRYLNTASRLYKYPFKEQLLIYAQRPDATACASIEIWNEKMHCWVNKGAKGIALIDEDSFSGLKYVFDISDVHKARKIGQFPNLWEMREEHMEAVISRLEKTYGDTDREAGFVGRIREIAGRIATEEELLSN